MASWIGPTWIAATVLTCPSLVSAETSLTVCSRPNSGFLLPDDAGGGVGFEHDVLTAFAEAEGLQLVFHWPDSFGELLDEVAAGRCDIGAAGITILESRRSLVDFSAPYFPLRVVVVAATELAAVNGANLSGMSVAVVEGGQHEELVRRQQDVNVVTAVGWDAVLKLVNDGKADVLVCDSVQAIHYLEENPELQVTAMLSDRQSFGFALPKDSPWTSSLSAFVEELREGPAYRIMLERHFPGDLVSSLFD